MVLPYGLTVAMVCGVNRRLMWRVSWRLTTVTTVHRKPFPLFHLNQACGTIRLPCVSWSLTTVALW